MCDQLSLVGDGDGCARKSALVDAGAKEVKGTLELFVLPLSAWDSVLLVLWCRKSSRVAFVFGL